MAKDEKKPRKESKKSTKASTTTKITTKKMRLSPEDTIAKSKKLVEKLQISRRNCNTKSPRLSSRPNNDSRVCTNGKPMPPLSELEKMFEDSDDDQPKTVTSNHKKSSNRSLPHTNTELTSPSTIKNIADKMMDLISNFPDPTSIVENGHPLPNILQKKRKKSATNAKGNDCSIEEENEEECQQKGPKRSNTVNGSDNITAWLENCEKADYNEGSNDSNKTVEYDYNIDTPIVTPSGRPHSFSPLPSTSKDKDTINRNDQLFNASLLSETNSKYNHSIDSILNTTTDSDTEIKLGETDHDKDTLQENPTNTTCNSYADDVEIIQPPPCETIVIDDEIEMRRPVKRRISDENDIECIEIFEPDILKKNLKDVGSTEAIIIDDDDGYKFMDDSPPCDDVTEVIDIDDIIAENKAIIEKYSKETKKDINTVTYVDSSTISNLNQDTANSPAPSSSSNTPDNLNKPFILASKRIMDTTEKMQKIVTNYFSNGHQNQPAEQISGSAALSSSWNKFSEWWNNLSHRNAANIQSQSRNVQNVERADDSVIIVDSPSPPVNVCHSVISPLHQFCSNNRTSRHQPTVQNNACANPWTNSTPAENGRHIGVYISGDQTNLDVHITGNNNRSQNFNRTVLPSLMQVSTPQTTIVPNPARALTPPPVKNYGDCPICMDSLAKNSVASTICGHVFCMKCIEAAFKASGKRCPTCRKVLKKGGYHQLFL